MTRYHPSVLACAAAALLCACASTLPGVPKEVPDAVDAAEMFREYRADAPRAADITNCRSTMEVPPARKKHRLRPPAPARFKDTGEPGLVHPGVPDSVRFEGARCLEDYGSVVGSGAPWLPLYHAVRSGDVLLVRSYVWPEAATVAGIDSSAIRIGGGWVPLSRIDRGEIRCKIVKSKTHRIRIAALAENRGGTAVVRAFYEVEGARACVLSLGAQERLHAFAADAGMNFFRITAERTKVRFR